MYHAGNIIKKATVEAVAFYEDWKAVL